MNPSKPLALLLIVFLITASSVSGKPRPVQTLPEAHKELTVDAYKSVPLLIEDIPANRLSLTEELVKTRAELRMRSAGLRPIVASGPHYLYINIRITGNAFRIDVDFMRNATWAVSADRRGTGFVRTWNAGGAGTAPSLVFILESLDGLMDQFLNAYLKANQDEK
jgi:hypothetical protein